MPEKKLLAIVTVLIMTGSYSAAQQAMTMDELREIEDLITQKDLRGLYSYLESNPEMTSGSDPLAVELRGFMQDADRGRLAGFAPPSSSMAFRGSVARAPDHSDASGTEIY